MPFDVLGSTCVTLMDTISFLRTEVCCLSLYRYGDGSWWLHQQFVLNMSLFFVHNVLRSFQFQRFTYKYVEMSEIIYKFIDKKKIRNTFLPTK